MFTPEMQQRQDREHLRLLAIFHFVAGGFALLGAGVMFLESAMMGSLFANPEMLKRMQQDPKGPPPEFVKHFMEFFVWIFLFISIFLVAMAILNVFSGLFLLRRKHRVFSVVVAAIDCLQIPIGTILGVFTILALSRDSVRQMYAEPDREFERQWHDRGF
ncbi:MAG TPA: hypothetical protein VHX65_20450 [Pirellulales bacterium]|nr:hypothetical protein [Pirellulales bacterium]